MKLRFTTHKHIKLCLALAGSLPWVSGSAIAANQNELSGVKNEISHQQRQISSQSKQLDQLQAELKKQELAISSLNRTIANQESTRDQANQKLTDIERQIASLTDKESEQKTQLEALVKSYYLMEKAKDATHILRPSESEDRISQYFQYLAASRAQALAALEDTQQRLSEQQQAAKREQQRLDKAIAELKQKRQALASTRSSRQSTIKSIKGKIHQGQSYLNELKKNEQRLKTAIAEAKRRSQVAMDGLSRQKGRLPWPIQGRLLHRYGTLQSGEIRWKGIVIAAQYQQKVSAVYSGTVVFADYLRGYGLVVLIDHGKGDMTLYGYNQTLMKKAGDKVQAGDTIALAGDTGGQSQPSVYFEIRRNSQANNPLNWLK